MRKHISMLLVIMGILCLGVGYSSLSTSLLISGEAKVNLLSIKDRILNDNGGIDYIESRGIPNLSIVATINEGMFSTLDNDGTSYYYRGVVDNNYLSFAGFLWRIIRINGDGSIRIILDSDLNENYAFNDKYDDSDIYSNMYYSNSTLKVNLENWYNDNLLKENDKIVNSEFCEEAKVTPANYYTFGDAIVQVYTEYTPRLTCKTDGNGYGILNSKIGLLSYDEIVFAGGYYGKANSDYYLYTGKYYWAMTPAGLYLDYVRGFRVNADGSINNPYVNITYQAVKPVISINGDLVSSGMGTKDDPYKV